MPEARLQIRLLGAPAVLLDGRDVIAQIKYRKGLALLALLAAEAERWLTRASLAQRLWPELPPGPALTNLRQVLSNLARVLNQDGVARLRCERERAGLFGPPGLACQDWLDMAWLDPAAMAERGAEQLEQWLPRFEARQQQLEGQFLDGLRIDAGADFEAWLMQTRVTLAATRRQALLCLCEAQQAAGRDAPAALSARQLVLADALDEAAAARLMRLLLRCGDRLGAATVFHALEHQLMAQLGSRPSAGTRALLHAPSQAPAGAPLPVAPPPAMAAEVRWLTLLQLELPVGADPAHCLPAVQLAQAQLRRWGAQAYPLQGTGMLACFGGDQRQEHGALRAVLAALALREALGAQERAPRIVICAGACLCTRRWPEGGVASSAPLPDIVGRLPGLAQRLAAAAQPGQVLLSAAVAAQLQGQFALQALAAPGAATLPEEGPLFALMHRLPRHGQGPAVRLVGRSAELGFLQRCWQQAQAGQPQWLLLRGEAGIGKTRLAQAFVKRAARRGAAPLMLSWWHCTLEHQQQSLAPLRQALAQRCGIQEGDTEALCMARLRSGLQAWLPPDQTLDDDGLRQLAGLFASAEADAPAQAKPALFEALFGLLDALCQRQPLLLVIDDMHWADQATRELLSRYAGRFASQRLLLLLTTRPDVPLPHAGTDPLCLDLQALPLAQALRMVAAQDPGGRLDAEQRARIAAACGGIPLFIERQTRSQLGEGSHQLVPVSELLQAELDRLGPFLPVLQAAAVMGQRFDAALLASLLPATEVAAVLAWAVQLQLLQAPDTATPLHSFRHALIRDAAYDSLPQPARRALHLQVAGQLQAQGDCAPAELARHFDAGERWAEAIAAWQRAGRQAMAREFAADAMGHFGRALELAQGPAAWASAALRPLRLELAYAALLCQGYGSALAHQQFSQVFDALAAPARLDQAPCEMRFQALSGMYWGAASQGRNDGLLIADRLEALAATPAQRLMACFAQGNSLFWAGQFERALRYQQEGASLSGRLPAAQRSAYSGDDLAVLVLAFQSWNHWFLGDAAAGRRIADEGIALARAEGKSHALCFMLTFAAALSWTDRDVPALLRHAGEGLALGTRFGFPLWQGINQLFGLWAQVETGALSDITPVLQAAELMRRAYQGGTTTARWVVCSTLLRLQQHGAAEALLRQTLADAEAFDDHYCRADLLAQLACCLRARGALDEATAVARDARELARRQGSQGLSRALECKP